MLSIVSTDEEPLQKFFNFLEFAFLDLVDQEGMIQFSIFFVNFLHVAVVDYFENAHADGKDIRDIWIVRIESVLNFLLFLWRDVTLRIFMVGRGNQRVG
jgi:hypothetical protein